jgi:hypothetical protein
MTRSVAAYDSARYPFLRVVLISLLALATMYLASGAWPPMPVFGDGIAIANGAEEIKRSGLGPNPLTYWYSQHPGTHAMTAGVSLATGLDTTRSFLLLAFLGAVMTVACATTLIARLLPAPWPVALLAVLLFQEASVAGYFGNGTVLASGFACAALMLLAEPRGPLRDVVAGLAIAAAGVMRLDAVVIVAAAAALILLGGRHRALPRLLLVGAVAGVALAASLYLLGFDPDEVAASLAFKEGLHESAGDLENTVRSLVAYFSVLCVLLMLSGLVSLWRDGRKDLLWLVFLGVLPTVLVFWSGIDTPRYLLYILPFVALLTARGLMAAWPPRGLISYLWLAALGAAFAGQYLLSYATRPADAPRGITVLAAMPVSEPAGHVRLLMAPPSLGGPPVIGVGNNGGRLAAGLVMSPRWHSRNKREAGARGDEIAAALSTAAETGRSAMSFGWTSGQLGIKALLAQGLRLTRHERGPDWGWDRYEFAGDDIRVEFTLYRYPIITKAISDGLAAVIVTPEPGTVVLVKGWVARKMGIEGDPDWERVGNGVYVRAP